MLTRWKRWVALLLLSFNATTAIANACVIACASAPMQSPAVSSHCHPDGVPATDECPQIELCAFAATPGLAPDAPSADVATPAYIQPLAAMVTRGVDPSPPLRPPPA